MNTTPFATLEKEAAKASTLAQVGKNLKDFGIGAAEGVGDVGLVLGDAVRKGRRELAKGVKSNLGGQKGVIDWDLLAAKLRGPRVNTPVPSFKKTAPASKAQAAGRGAGFGGTVGTAGGALTGLLMNALSKEAANGEPLSVTDAAVAGAVGPLVSGLHSGMSTDDASQGFRSGGKALLGGAGGYLAGAGAGAGVGALLARVLSKGRFKNHPSIKGTTVRPGARGRDLRRPPTLPELFAMLGAGPGGMTGAALGSASAAKNYNEREGLSDPGSKIAELFSKDK